MAQTQIGEAQTLPLTQLNTYHRNPRRGDVEAIKGSLVANGQYRPIVVNAGTHTGRPYEVLAGNHTLKAYRELAEEHPGDYAEIACWVVDVDDDRATRIVLADNRTADLGDYDEAQLLELLSEVDYDLDGTGYDYEDLDELAAAADTNIEENTDDEAPSLTLAERFLMPPMTILDTRRGEWQDRKRAWLAMGIASQEGRAEDLIFDSVYTRYDNWYDVWNEAVKAHPGIAPEEVEKRYQHKLRLYRGGNGTSAFDPVLAEILYLWFSNPGDRVIDPWAGGSVRGLVANRLGRNYQGHELRTEQCEENEKQWGTVERADQEERPTNSPVWIPGDSRETLSQVTAETYDFAIGCPPYYDLEEYSDDANDLSNMTTEEFNNAMKATLAEVDRTLRENRFAAFVVGSARDKKGDLRDMKSCLISAAPDRWKLANDAVLLSQVGPTAIRAKNSFEKGRSLGRCHQDILIFVKGSRREAARRLAPVEVAGMEHPGDGAEK